MSMQSGRAVIDSAYQDLQVQWRKTRLYWDDAVARDFERSQLDPLDQRIKAALASVEEIAALLARARRDCG